MSKLLKRLLLNSQKEHKGIKISRTFFRFLKIMKTKKVELFSPTYNMFKKSNYWIKTVSSLVTSSSILMIPVPFKPFFFASIFNTATPA